MNTATGFYQSSGVFVPCPACKNQVKVTLANIGLANKLVDYLKCPTCKVNLEIDFGLRVVEAVEHSVAADVAYCHLCQHGHYKPACPECHKVPG